MVFKDKNVTGTIPAPPPEVVGKREGDLEGRVKAVVLRGMSCKCACVPGAATDLLEY